MDDRARGRRPRPALQPPGPRRLLHRLPLVRLARTGRHLGIAARGEGRAGARLHRRLLRDHVREPRDRRPARASVPPDGPVDARGRAGRRATSRRPSASGAGSASASRCSSRSIAGIGVSSQWQEWILFTNRRTFGVKDPQFHKDVGFYVFQLPFIRFIIDWLFAGLVIVLLVTAVAHYLNGGIRFQSPFQRVTPQVKAHLSVILAVMALVKTAEYYFARFELNFSDRGVRRRRQLHRREGAAARAEPADLHLDRRGRAVHLEHLAARLGAADHRGRALGVRLARRRHDLPGDHPAVPGEAERVREGAPVHRAQHRGDARRRSTSTSVAVENFDYTTGSRAARRSRRTRRRSTTRGSGTRE